MEKKSRKKCSPIVLDSVTQIEILYLLDRGKSLKEIDLYLGVPAGSSARTLKVAGRRTTDEKIS